MPLNPRTGLPVKPASVREGASRADCTTRTIHNYFNRGLLTRYRRGGRVFVDLNEVDSLLVADIRDGGAA
ncbi:hypothetical protein ABIC28_002045 [Rhodococcus sp. PvR044]